MIGRTDKNPQLDLLKVQLTHFINPEHELTKLASKINWDTVESDLAVYFSPRVLRRYQSERWSGSQFLSRYTGSAKSTPLGTGLITRTGSTSVAKSTSRTILRSTITTSARFGNELAMKGMRR